MYKNKCVCFNEVIWLITIKVRLKLKNRVHRYDINRSRPRHGHKCNLPLHHATISLQSTPCNGHYQTVHLPPPTPTHPKYFPTYPHQTKIMPHPTPTHTHPPKIIHHKFPPTPTHPTFTQKNASLTATHVKYGPIIHIYSNFSWSRGKVRSSYHKS